MAILIREREQNLKPMRREGDRRLRLRHDVYIYRFIPMVSNST